MVLHNYTEECARPYNYLVIMQGRSLARQCVYESAYIFVTERYYPYKTNYITHIDKISIYTALAKR